MVTKSPKSFPFKALAECTRDSGGAAFADAFARMLEQELRVDQCMLFVWREDRPMRCLLSLNFQDKTLARPLAGAYIGGGYLQDPNLDLLKNAPSGEWQIIRFRDVEQGFPEEYRNRFFSIPGIIDKISLIRRDQDQVYYLNLYRSRDHGPFSDQNPLQEEDFAALIGSLLLSHFRHMRPGLHAGPLSFLSPQEQTVCSGILQGQKTERIAHEMGVSPHTVTTYRKRAYTKLGIRSRAELFELCREA
tara:strand:+ start:391 stop:1131 length:741 start_codon:yes stop_codon:yes gene_type:complete